MEQCEPDMINENEKKVFCPRCFEMYQVPGEIPAGQFKCLRCEKVQLREGMILSAEEIYALRFRQATPARDESALERHFGEVNSTALWEIHNPTESDEKFAKEVGIKL